MRFVATLLAGLALVTAGCAGAAGKQASGGKLAGSGSLGAEPMCVEGMQACQDQPTGDDGVVHGGDAAAGKGGQGVGGSVGTGQILCDGPDQPAANGPADTDCSMPDAAVDPEL